MNFLEKNLEDIIFETDNVDLRKRDLFIFGKKKRQVRIGNYGTCDLITLTRYYGSESKSVFVLTVFELKKDVINENAFFQCLRYLKGVKSYLSRRFPCWNIDYRMCLIGSSFDEKSSIIYAADIIEKFSIYTYLYNYNGISFEKKSDYILTEEGFNNVK